MNIVEEKVKNTDKNDQKINKKGMEMTQLWIIRRHIKMFSFRLENLFHIYLLYKNIPGSTMKF